MKKPFLLISMSLLILSCSTDSEPKTDPDDKIIGTWQFYGSKYYATDGSTFEREANSCTGQSTITFRRNETISSMTYMVVFFKML